MQMSILASSLSEKSESPKQPFLFLVLSADCPNSVDYTPERSDNLRVNEAGFHIHYAT